ncbi:MAG: hypothetical protein L0207_03565 [Chlamydiae bacterium]|nr:hypothetical protein [Chlamydiota bacterium]
MYFFCKTRTDGFIFDEIIFPKKYWPKTNLSQDPKLLDEIISQPFYYLGKGTQTYAFGSQDGKWVIKFLRIHRLKWTDFFFRISPSFFQKRIASTLEKRKNKLQKDITSFQIAYSLFKEESGLIYLHLEDKPVINQSLHIYDKINVHHEIPLDSLPFIVQKKATDLYSSLEKWINQNEMETAKEALSHLVSLLKARCVKGIHDKDANLKTNFGFVGTRPIQYDIGRFKMVPLTEIKEEVIRITDSLVSWLEKISPSLALYLKNEIKKTF